MLLFITQNYNSFFGGGVITQRNLTVCRKVFGEENVQTFFLPEKTSGGLATIRSFLTGYLMGLGAKQQQDIIQYIRENPSIEHIFIDNSMLGRLAKSIKKEFPNIKVIVFFHNVEILFFISFLRSTKRYLHSIGLASIFFNEKMAAQYADTIVTLNFRDSIDLKRKYGKQANLILPTSIEDKFDPAEVKNHKTNDKIKLLFVGSRFFPNEHGIKWFITHVLPNLKNAYLQIVGKGFEELKGELESHNVEVIGACDDISPFYYETDIVVAPIFTGSGMKTKTAEALMYGKTILASTEAWQGYEVDKKISGGEFNSAQQYIDYINNYDRISKFNAHSRNYFLKLYSFTATARILSLYLEKESH